MSNKIIEELEGLEPDEINLKIRMMSPKARKLFLAEWAHEITFDQLCHLEQEYKFLMDMELVGNKTLGSRGVDRHFYIAPTQKALEAKEARNKPSIVKHYSHGSKKEIIDSPRSVRTEVGVYLSNKYGPTAMVQRLRGLIKGISEEEYLEYKQAQKKSKPKPKAKTKDKE